VNLTSRQGEGGPSTPFPANTVKVPPTFFTADFTDYADGKVFIRIIREIRGSFFHFSAAWFVCGFSRSFAAFKRPFLRFLRILAANQYNRLSINNLHLNLSRSQSISIKVNQGKSR
jgi:hypothetical protein